MRILFAATGDIAIPTLETLNSLGLLGGVLTAPDKRGKRGKDLIPTPIKKRALELGLTVFTPEHLGLDARRDVATLYCDTLVSFCYGKIFGPKFLALFSKTFNIHPSLLPKYRGCAPIKETILHQDRECGISIQEIALKCDEGDIYTSCRFALKGDETEESLSVEVSKVASELAKELFTNLDSYKSLKQEGEVSWSYLTAKEEARLTLDDDFKAIHAKVRAYYPWPKAYFLFKGEPLYLCGVSDSIFTLSQEEPSEEAGTVVGLDKNKGLKVAFKGGYLYFNRLQRPTKKELSAADFVNGNRDIIGAKLS